MAGKGGPCGGEEEGLSLSFSKPRDPAAPTRYVYAMNCGPEAGMSMALIEEVFKAFGEVEHVVPVGDNGTRVVVIFSESQGAARAREALNLQPCVKAGGRVMRLEYAELRPRQQVDHFPVALSTEEMGIPGMSIHLDFVTAEEEKELLAAVDEQPWHTLSKRRVQHYGFEFQYKIRDVNRDQRLGELPSFVTSVVQRMEALPELLNNNEPCLPLDQLTVNEYLRGVGLAPHVDTHTAFEGAVISLSLAGPCIMQFRRPREPTGGDQRKDTWQGSETLHNSSEKGRVEENESRLDSQGEFKKKSLFLPERSLLVLRGEARYAWSHYIPHHKVDIVNGIIVQRKSRRVSFTFRKVRRGPCRCEYPWECDGRQVASPAIVEDLQGIADNEKLEIDQEHQGFRNSPVEGTEEVLKSAVHNNESWTMDSEGELDKAGCRGVANLTNGAEDETDAFSGDSRCHRTPQDVSEEFQEPSEEFQLSTPDSVLVSCGDKFSGTEKEASKGTPAIERTFVHQVYDAIAPHFSSTRFAKWPKVAAFLSSLSPGSLVADVGCGNGKYLGFNPSCYFIGCDISPSLVGICAKNNFQVLVADGLVLPYRWNTFDAAISIAVLHHLSTIQRRRLAIVELLRIVRSGGRVLITVWAREQEDESLVAKWTPLSGKHTERWVDMPEGGQRSRDQSTKLENIPESNQNLGGEMSAIISLTSGPEVDLECSTSDGCQRFEDRMEVKETNRESLTGHDAVEQEYFVPWHLPYHRAEISGASAQALSTGFARKDDKKGAVVYNRYYHVFQQGELERLAASINGAVIEDSFYDRSNWCVILRKL